MNRRTEGILSTHVHPLLAFLMRRFLPRATNRISGNEGHFTAELTDGWRDPKIQMDLYAKGRNDQGVIVEPDKVVTRAKWWESCHSFLPKGLAIAVDIAPHDSTKPRRKRFYWPEPKPANQTIEELKRASEAAQMWEDWANLALSMGLEPGYLWKKPDGPHFQLNLGYWQIRDLHRILKNTPKETAKKWITKEWRRNNPKAWDLYGLEYQLQERKKECLFARYLPSI